MSDEWGKTDEYDPWATDVAPASVTEKEGNPPTQQKTDEWGTTEEYDPWAAPDQSTGDTAPSDMANKKSSREKKTGGDRRPKSTEVTGQSKSPRERKPPATASEAGERPNLPSQDDVADGKERKKTEAYVNPARVNTGGAQRDKLSEEELTARMTKMREQNEKIKQRRMDVLADEDAFKKTQESERLKQEKITREQEHVNHTREQNAKRKMDKTQSREWDSGKPSVDRHAGRPRQEEDGPSARGRGGGRGGRGRGLGRDTESIPPASESTPAVGEA